MVLSDEILIGGILSDGSFDKSKLLPIFIMLILFIVNYAYFTSGSRFRKIIGKEESLVNSDPEYISGLVYLLSSMFVLFVLAAVLFFNK